jgi:hypothetical protein
LDSLRGQRGGTGVSGYDAYERHEALVAQQNASPSPSPATHAANAAPTKAAASVAATSEAAQQDGGAQRLDKNKKKELYRKARKYAIKGRSKMSKRELVVAVRSAQKALGERLRRRGKGKGKRTNA